jgi:hypothetical protein
MGTQVAIAAGAPPIGRIRRGRCPSTQTRPTERSSWHSMEARVGAARRWLVFAGGYRLEQAECPRPNPLEPTPFSAAFRRCESGSGKRNRAVSKSVLASNICLRYGGLTVLFVRLAVTAWRSTLTQVDPAPYASFGYTTTSCGWLSHRHRPIRYRRRRVRVSNTSYAI